MNLAIRDVGRHLPRFVGTSAGLGLLLTVVIAMQGIYAGMVDDAIILTRAMQADLWLVQRDTRGPFAESSRLDPSIEGRAAAVPGVKSARPYTYQLIQRDGKDDVLRIALVGLGWPEDRGEKLPLVRGRALSHAHGELVVDASLGMALGETLDLAGESYKIVGLTKNALTSGGDSVAFLTVSDAQQIAYDQPPEATMLERQRVVARLRKTELGRTNPSLEALPTDDRWRSPAVSSPPLAAVLVQADAARLPEVMQTLKRWGDVQVYTQAEEEALLLGGVVQRARLQIGLFTVILTVTAAVVIAMVMYNMTLEKTKDLAVLKLLGAPAPRLMGLVMQQAWMLGFLGYVAAWTMGRLVYPVFPRRVVMTSELELLAPVATFIVVTLASLLGLLHVQRIDPASALEG